MSSKQQAVMTYLAAQLGRARVSLTELKREYQFYIFLPGKGMAHRVRFNRREFDQSSLPHLLALCSSNEIAKAIAIAPFALDILFTNGTAHAAPRTANL